MVNKTLRLPRSAEVHDLLAQGLVLEARALAEEDAHRHAQDHQDDAPGVVAADAQLLMHCLRTI